MEGHSPLGGVADCYERRRLRELEAQKQAALRREQERQRQIKLLLTLAENLQKADTIRRLVDTLMANQNERANDRESVSLSNWEKWARGIADDLDPRLLTLSELLTMNVGVVNSKS